MRIRSIKPEFWRSTDIADLPRDVRLLFIGLWSYVDDNGVGIDDHRAIAADLFALDDDPVETRDYVRDGLATLSRVSLITRYEVRGKRYLFINTWDKHQRIDRPGKPRYPRPDDPDAELITDTTSENTPVRDSVATPSRDSREPASTGTGEQGNRGTEEQRAASVGNPLPRGRGISGPAASRAYRLVDDTIGRDVTSATRTGLAIEVAALLAEVDDATIVTALQRWNARTGIGPRMLPGLVDDIRKEARGATTQPATMHPTDANVALLLGAGPTPDPDPIPLRAIAGGTP